MADANIKVDPKQLKKLLPTTLKQATKTCTAIFQKVRLQ